MLPKEFLHAPQNDIMVLHNLHITKKLFSCESVQFEDQTYPSMRDIPVVDLRTGKFRLGTLSPRMSRTVVMASMIRNGQSIGAGIPRYQTDWIGVDAERRILKESDDELAFEEGRRAVARHAPSRLTALFVGEVSDKFEEWVRIDYPSEKNSKVFG